MMPAAVWDFPDPEIEERAKETGIARSESANWRNVQLAREIARDLYLANRRPIAADEVRQKMAERFPDTVFGNWCGSIFKSREWRAVGFIKSRTKGRHSNRIFTWELASSSIS